MRLSYSLLMKGKKPRLNNRNNNTDDDFVVDRISDLPDSILGHILSFLPTDKAVATSILSKRWKFAWVLVHSLDLSNREDEEEDILAFARFVDRVLLLTDGGCLNKFCLHCPFYCESISPQIISWINTAITRNVHELNLSNGDMDLPACLFTCESLRSLEMCGILHISISNTTAVRLPRLQSLKLRGVYFESEEVWEKLLSGCPVLDYLKLFDRTRDDSTCIISSTSLRFLDLEFMYTTNLKLKASSIEYLRLGGRISKIFVEKNLGSLDIAHIDISLNEHDVPNNSIVKAIRALDCAKFLTLSSDVMRALSRATISLSTKFKKLVTLEAKKHISSALNVIQSADNLEDLIILKFSENNLHGHSGWTTPIEVPRCLSNSLKKIEIKLFKGLEDEREMIRYVLQYGSALEALRICCNVEEYGEKLEVLQKICKFPRKSPACNVQIFMLPSERQYMLPLERQLEPFVLISRTAGELLYLS